MHSLPSLISTDPNFLAFLPGATGPVTALPEMGIPAETGTTFESLIAALKPAGAPSATAAPTFTCGEVAIAAPKEADATPAAETDGEVLRSVTTTPPRMKATRAPAPLAFTERKTPRADSSVEKPEADVLPSADLAMALLQLTPSLPVAPDPIAGERESSDTSERADECDGADALAAGVSFASRKDVSVEIGRADVKTPAVASQRGEPARVELHPMVGEATQPPQRHAEHPAKPNTTGPQADPRNAEKEIVSAVLSPQRTAPAVVAVLPDQPSASATPRGIPAQAAELVAHDRSRRELGTRGVQPLAGKERAIFAEISARPAGEIMSRRESFDKSIVATSDEQLTERRMSLGIDGAKSEPSMSQASVSSLSPHPMFEYIDSAVRGLDASVGAFELPDAPAAEVSDTQRAVETVLQAVEQVADREQTSVQLEFAVGDADLVVRVELHAEEVRTTFRTDSTELRAALETEWEVVAAGSVDRGLKLAPAVFAPAEPASGNGFSGDASTRQHHRPATPPDERFGSSGAPSRTAETAATTMSGAIAGGPAFAPAGTAQRLNLFA